jgi:hypothetical protein
MFLSKFFSEIIETKGYFLLFKVKSSQNLNKFYFISETSTFHGNLIDTSIICW